MDGIVEEEEATKSTEEPKTYVPDEPTILSSIWRYRAVAIGFTIAVLAIAALYGYSRPHQYVAEATLIVQAPNGVDSNDLGRYVADQVAILQSQELTRKALHIAEHYHLAKSYSEDSFVGSTDVVTSMSSDVILINFTAKTPRLAQVGANALGTAYRGTRFDSSVGRVIFLPAKRPDAPTSTALLRLMAVALVLGLLASAALCYILALRNWRAAHGVNARRQDS